MSIVASLFYCFNAHKHQGERSNQQGQKKALATGIDKEASVEGDYLEVFDKLSLNLMQFEGRELGAQDLKIWAINCADEIKTELKVRSFLRNQAKEALIAKLTRSQDPSTALALSDANNRVVIDDMELVKRRLRYWDYVRSAVQFISIQNRVLAKVL